MVFMVCIIRHDLCIVYAFIALFSWKFQSDLSLTCALVLKTILLENCSIQMLQKTLFHTERGSCWRTLSNILGFFSTLRRRVSLFIWIWSRTWVLASENCMLTQSHVQCVVTRSLILMLWFIFQQFFRKCCPWKSWKESWNVFEFYIRTFFVFEAPKMD